MAAASALAVQAAGASAEIVLFPGVRYERHAEGDDKSKKSKRRRDTMELES